MEAVSRPLLFVSVLYDKRKSKAVCLDLLSSIGMSGGGGFGGMDNLGNMGSFGGRMSGKFFIWKTINIVRRRPSQNKQH